MKTLMEAYEAAGRQFPFEVLVKHCAYAPPRLYRVCAQSSDGRRFEYDLKDGVYHQGYDYVDTVMQHVELRGARQLSPGYTGLCNPVPPYPANVTTPTTPACSCDFAAGQWGCRCGAFEKGD